MPNIESCFVVGKATKHLSGLMSWHSSFPYCWVHELKALLPPPVPPPGTAVSTVYISSATFKCWILGAVLAVMSEIESDLKLPFFLQLKSVGEEVLWLPLPIWHDWGVGCSRLFNLFLRFLKFTRQQYPALDHMEHNVTSLRILKAFLIFFF